MTRRTATIIGGIGQSLIALGLCVLLFAGFQLWGTGIATQAAQNNLEDEFAAQLERVKEAAASQQTTTTATAPSVDSTDPSASATPTTRPPAEVAPELAEALLPARGEAAGRIEIDKIGLDWIYLEGVGRSTLRNGPGHYPTTPLPGQAGNAAIAGHRTTNGSPFSALDRLEPGDPIIVSTAQGEFRYEVIGYENEEGETVGHRIVAPTEVSVIEDYDDNRLTLTACNPKFSARERIIIAAELVSAPGDALPIPASVNPEESEPALQADEYADAPEELDQEPASTLSTTASDFADTLGWNYDERRPTLIWGAIALLIAIAGAVLGVKWKKWPAYGLTLIVFAPVLYKTFEHLDKFIPAF